VRQVFRNLAAALRGAGSGMDRVVKLTIFLTDLDDVGVFRKVRDEYVDVARPPASSLVQVRGLLHPAFRVEVEALAEAG
jgi:enamine deaminase RidA (YjgF/YER057c/UK114 family)